MSTWRLRRRLWFEFVTKFELNMSEQEWLIDVSLFKAEAVSKGQHFDIRDLSFWLAYGYHTTRMSLCHDKESTCKLLSARPCEPIIMIGPVVSYDAQRANIPAVKLLATTNYWMCKGINAGAYLPIRWIYNTKPVDITPLSIRWYD